MRGKLFTKALAVATSVLMLSGGLSVQPFADIFKGTSITAYAQGTEVNLSTLTGSYTAQDGDILSGTTSQTVNIANGASITLNGATITGGIVCEGTATITLDGTNIVNVNDALLPYSKAGIQIGSSGTTLTIRGSGSLTATGGSAAAGIGIGRTWDASVTAGAIVIEGGTINASGGNGIGTGTVGNDQTAAIDGISIKGGTVNASLGKGYIYYGCTATVGYIKIYDTIDMVDASKITETVTYMHVDGESATDVTASKTDYFTISEDGDRRIITPKDDTDYTITLADGIEHGTITGATTAKYMETVTINATPDFGYRLVRLVVKDAYNNDVASTGNTFLMPKGNVTVSAVFEQGTHGTTEFTWFYTTGPQPQDQVLETIYDGVTTVSIQTFTWYNIRKYNENTNFNFRLDNDIIDADIPYAGGTGEFYNTRNATNFCTTGNTQTGYYDITMTDVGNDKWYVSFVKTAPKMDVVPDQTYTGSAITPEPLVVAGSLSLTKGTDYEYSYENNTDVGTATVKVTFKGDYESLGYVEKTFNIVRNIYFSDSIENGSVTADRYLADEGDTVTLTATPAEGYAVGSVSVNDGTVAVTKNTDGTYSFTMPDGDVTVNAVFVSTKLTDEEYTQTATYTDPDTGDKTYYTRYVFVKAKSDIEGKSKATFTATYNGTPYTYETNTYYTGVTSNGITYTPAEDSVLFVVTVSSSSDISAGLTCELKLE